MAGEAKTNAFMLGTATLMLGPQSELFDLNVDEHSVGMAKNVTMKSSPGFTELTQGVKNTLVYSVMTSNKVTVDAEVYEYTGKNLAYSVGLDGSAIAPTTAVGQVGTEYTTGVSLILEAGDGTNFAVNDWISVQVGADDQVFVRKVSAKATDTLTIDSALPITIPVGATVKKLNIIGVGSKADQPFLSAKIVGTIADGSEIAILIPKVRITSGASLAFKNDGYDNIPMQLAVYDLVNTDPHYATFKDIGNAMIATPN